MLTHLDSGSDNVAVGFSALLFGQLGNKDSATGSEALLNTTTGSNNVATGYDALLFNTAGDNNTAIGSQALFDNTGNSKVAIGFGAGKNLTSGRDNVDIANIGGGSSESKTIRIGTEGTQTKAFLAGVGGATVKGSAQPVLIDGKGKLGTATAASAATSATAPSADRKLRAKVNRLQRAVRQLRAEVKQRR